MHIPASFLQDLHPIDNYIYFKPAYSKIFTVKFRAPTAKIKVGTKIGTKVWLFVSHWKKSAQPTHLERLVLLTDDISSVSSENVEKSQYSLHELRPRNDEPATVAGDQVHGTIGDLSAPTGQFVHTTGRRSSTTNNPQSTADEGDDREVMIM